MDITISSDPSSIFKAPQINFNASITLLPEGIKMQSETIGSISVTAELTPSFNFNFKLLNSELALNVFLSNSVLFEGRNIWNKTCKRDLSLKVHI